MANGHRKINRIKKQDKFQEFFSKMVEDKFGTPVHDLNSEATAPILATNDEEVADEQKAMQQKAAMLGALSMGALATILGAGILTSKTLNWSKLLKK